jgi:hypothetical protein
MLRKTAGLTGAFVMLVAALVVVPQRGKAADVDQVLVVNGPRRPIPVNGSVAVAGTVNANVTNTPNVNVTGLPAVQLAPGTSVGVNGTVNTNVTNTPNVNVTGLPAVQLAAGTSVGINGTPNVNVANIPTVNANLTPGSMVGISPTANGVQDVDNAARHAAPASVSFDYDAGNGDAEIPVPAGNRMVVEFISIDVLAPPGPPPTVQVATRIENGAQEGPFIPLTLVNSGIGSLNRNKWVGNLLTRLYAAAGNNNLDVSSERVGPAGTITVEASVSGYLVSVP